MGGNGEALLGIVQYGLHDSGDTHRDTPGAAALQTVHLIRPERRIK